MLHHISTLPSHFPKASKLGHTTSLMRRARVGYDVCDLARNPARNRGRLEVPVHAGRICQMGRQTGRTGAEQPVMAMTRTTSQVDRVLVVRKNTLCIERSENGYLRPDPPQSCGRAHMAKPIQGHGCVKKTDWGGTANTSPILYHLGRQNREQCDGTPPGEPESVLDHCV